MKAIQTKYKGYHFRSLTEARWAVFMDELGIEWEYEKEGFDLGERGWYLPDFYVTLPHMSFWLEVKGVDPTDDELMKGHVLCDQSEEDVYFAVGAPTPPQESGPQIIGWQAILDMAHARRVLSQLEAAGISVELAPDTAPENSMEYESALQIRGPIAYIPENTWTSLRLVADRVGDIFRCKREGHAYEIPEWMGKVFAFAACEECGLIEVCDIGVGGTTLCTCPGSTPASVATSPVMMAAYEAARSFRPDRRGRV